MEEFRAELEAKQIDMNKLIKGNSDLIKNNAQQFSEALLEFWFGYVSLNDKLVIQEVFGQDTSLDNIKDMYQKLFRKLGIAKRIAEKIRRYVDGQNKADLHYEIVADISTELLNRFINTVGFEYLDDSEINDLRQANVQNSLGLEAVIDPSILLDSHRSSLVDVPFITQDAPIRISSLNYGEGYISAKIFTNQDTLVKTYIRNYSWWELQIDGTNTLINNS